MKLTEVGIERLTQHLQNFLQLECPLCENRRWNATDEIMQLTPYSGKKTLMGGDFLPLVVISCDRCGYTYLFNAIAAGVVEVNTKSTAIAVIS